MRRKAAGLIGFWVPFAAEPARPPAPNHECPTPEMMRAGRLVRTVRITRRQAEAFLTLRPATAGLLVYVLLLCFAESALAPAQRPAKRGPHPARAAPRVVPDCAVVQTYISALNPSVTSLTAGVCPAAVVVSRTRYWKVLCGDVHRPVDNGEGAPARVRRRRVAGANRQFDGRACRRRAGPGRRFQFVTARRRRWPRDTSTSTRMATGASSRWAADCRRRRNRSPPAASSRQSRWRATRPACRR